MARPPRPPHERREAMEAMADAYVHALLDEAGRRHVETQLEKSEAWRAALAEARRRAELMQEVPPEAPGADLLDRAARRVARRARRDLRLRCWGMGLLGAGVCVACVVLAVLHAYAVWRPGPAYDLQVIGQQRLWAGSEAAMRVRLVDVRAPRPVAGARGRIVLRGGGEAPRELARFVTDEHGSAAPRFAVPDWPEGDYELEVRAATAQREVVYAGRLAIRRGHRVALSADKPVYRPGEVIRLRGLALRQPDGAPAAGAPAVFTVTDPNGNIIFQDRKPASDFGIVSTECALAETITEGAYRVACTVGATESARTVEVRAYALPRFSVDVELERGWYAPGETVRGRVRAAYFFGKPVTGGRVRVAWAVAGDPESAPGQEMAFRTDETGTARFELALPRFLSQPSQAAGTVPLRLQVTVTDAAGRVQARRLSRPVSGNPLRLTVLPEAGSLVAGVANRVHVLAHYPDGTPAEATLEVKRGRRSETLQTSSRGLASFEFVPQASWVSLHLKATDGAGHRSERRVNLATGDLDEDFLLRPDRAVYRGGQTVQLQVRGAGTGPVFIDLLQEGQTRLSESIAMRGGRGEGAIELPAALSGTLQLEAYRPGTGGRVVRRRRVIHVRPASSLDLSLAPDQPTYRPGASARIELQVSDDRGRPVPAAISLAAVDEAVFHVLDAAPGRGGYFGPKAAGLPEPVEAMHGGAIDGDEAEGALQAARFAAAASGAYLEAEPAAAGRLREAGAPRTRFARTYPRQTRKAQRARAEALARVFTGWKIMAGVFAGALLGGGWMRIGIPWRLLLATATVASLAIGGLGPWLEAAPDPPARREREVAPVAPIESRGAPGAREGDRLAADSPGARPVRVREAFPETLLWRPELITDEAGRVSVPVRLADAITSWRLAAGAVAADGRIAAAEEALEVFQPFFVEFEPPGPLTRGDEISVPVVVYNELDRPQTVRLTFEAAGGLEITGPLETALEIEPHEVRVAHLPLAARRVGRHALEVTARGESVADAVRRHVRVAPGGRRVERVFNGRLEAPAEISFEVPDHAIEGSLEGTLKFYPTTFSQVLEGLEGIFAQPHGCFEQTSSTTYPNVLALRYLEASGTVAPAVRATARRYIHEGYQRLLTFEIEGGGFEWFGRPPADVLLTAYGLMQFEAMARVHDVDPGVIRRTRRWLLEQRSGNGAWPGSGGGEDAGRRTVTALAAWACFGEGGAREGGAREGAPGARRSRRWLTRHGPGAIESTYELALTAGALVAMDPQVQRDSTRAWVDELARRRRREGAGGQKAWWPVDESRRGLFHGGRPAVEATALAAWVMMRAGREGLARPALRWLIEARDGRGTWGATFPTVLALKALALAAEAEAAGGAPGARAFTVRVDDGAVRRHAVPAGQAEVLQRLDLSGALRRGERHRLGVAETTGAGGGYQFALAYQVPEAVAGDPAAEAPLSIELAYDRRELKVEEEVGVSARIRGTLDSAAPMVLVHLPIPPGFEARVDDFSRMVESGRIARFQVRSESVVLYLRALPPGPALELRYRLRAAMPGRVRSPAAEVYEYYAPARRGLSPSVPLEVNR